MVLTLKRMASSTALAHLLLAFPSFALAEPPIGAQATALSDTKSGQQVAQTALIDDIVVTGSRIRRNSFTGSQPISVITSEQAALEGIIDTTAILQSHPTAATASQTNNYFTGYIVTGGAGVNTISLRGLGADRTLVLVNGRRMGPAGISGQVAPIDLNTLTSSQIYRIEILTDGASSIYGSDAVAGVVNILTKTTQTGGEFLVNTKLPFEPGGEEFQVATSHGWNNGRGYLNLGAQYYERKALLFGDRDVFACPQDRYYYDPGLKIRADVVDPKTGDYKCISGPNNLVRAYRFNGVTRASFEFEAQPSAVAGGGFQGCDLAGWRFAYGGLGTSCDVTVLPPQDQRALYSKLTTHSDRYDQRTVISPVRRYALSAFAGYDLTPNIEAFGEIFLNRRESQQYTWKQLFPAVSFHHPHYPFPALEPTLGPLLDYAIPVAYVPQFDGQQVDYVRGVAGLRGKLNLLSNLDWELVAQYSRSNATYESDVYYADRIYAVSGYHEGRNLIGETVFPSGFARGSLATELAATGCIKSWLRSANDCPTGGVNWFSPSFLSEGRLSPAEAAFISGRDIGTTLYTHAYVEGTISGDVFELPTGSVSAVLGFQYRQEALDDQPGMASQDSNVWGNSTAGRTQGKDKIKEAFAEIEIPLLQNLALAQSLTVNLSGRYSDYASYGDNSTYKFGVNWQITPEYRLRGSYGTAFRAPALYELYLADQTTFASQTNIDPCINWGLSKEPTVRTACAAEGIPSNYNASGNSSARILSGGGLGNLKAETAESLSAGFIWSPKFTDFNLVIDYYRVKIKDQVTRLGAANIVVTCYGAAGYRNTSHCAQFDRAAADSAIPYHITTIRNSFINISEQMNEGLDLNMRYTKAFKSWDMEFNAHASYILEWDFQLSNQSKPQSQLNNISFPDWILNLGLKFDHKDWTFNWNAEIVPETTNKWADPRNLANGEIVYIDRTADTTLYHTLSVRKKADKWVFIAGINNIFAENAPWTSSVGGSRGAGNVPLASQYDYVGRRAFISIVRNW